MARLDDDPRTSFHKMMRRFREMFPGSLAYRDMMHGASPETWDPPADIYETESSVVIRVEAGGMHKNDFDVKLAADSLRIRGCRMENEPHPKTRIHQMELNYGPFEKIIRGIPPIRTEQIQATYKNGFLVITLPKAEPK
ncbi:MAG: hypothetical protein DRP79_09345 [Planctomycetota bacterium]|nr:MAG: hypothetical protein DRP79_09345 [Planctomycetota bacterium]